MSQQAAGPYPALPLAVLLICPLYQFLPPPPAACFLELLLLQATHMTCPLSFLGGCPKTSAQVPPSSLRAQLRRRGNTQATQATAWSSAPAKHLCTLARALGSDTRSGFCCIQGGVVLTTADACVFPSYHPSRVESAVQFRCLILSLHRDWQTDGVYPKV